MFCAQPLCARQQQCCSSGCRQVAKVCQVEPSEGVRCWHGGGTAGCAWACESRTYLSCCTLQSDCPPAFLSLQLDDAGAMEAAKQRRQEEIRARLAAGERSLGSAALRGQLLCSPCLLAAQHLRSRLPADCPALPCPAATCPAVCRGRLFSAEMSGGRRALTNPLPLFTPHRTHVCRHRQRCGPRQCGSGGAADSSRLLHARRDGQGDLHCVCCAAWRVDLGCALIQLCISWCVPPGPAAAPCRQAAAHKDALLRSNIHSCNSPIHQVLCSS